MTENPPIESVYASTIRSHAALIARHPLDDLRACDDPENTGRSLLLNTCSWLTRFLENLASKGVEVPLDLLNGQYANDLSAVAHGFRILGNLTEEQIMAADSDLLGDADVHTVTFVEAMRHFLIGDEETDPTHSTLGDFEALSMRLGDTPGGTRTMDGTRPGTWTGQHFQAAARTLAAVDFEEGWDRLPEDVLRRVEVAMSEALAALRSVMHTGVEPMESRVRVADMDAVGRLNRGEPVYLDEAARERMDEMVHDAASQIGSQVNNEGQDAQMEFLREQGVTMREVLDTLSQ